MDKVSQISSQSFLPNITLPDILNLKKILSKQTGLPMNIYDISDEDEEDEEHEEDEEDEEEQKKEQKKKDEQKYEEYEEEDKKSVALTEIESTVVEELDQSTEVTEVEDEM
jgi:ABC-type Zn2+ transport system substrate-binding protein/surface adhesin